MTVKLLTEHHLESLSLKKAAQARPSLHLSKCLIVGNHVSWLISGIFLAQNIIRENIPFAKTDEK